MKETQTIKEFISNIIKSDNVSQFVIDECQKINNSLVDIEKASQEQDAKHKELQDKYADLILHYPITTEPQQIIEEPPKEKTLEELIEDTIKERNQRNNFIGD